MAAIQAFWLAASGVADKIANWPPSSPSSSSAMSAITTPVSSKSTWATNRLSPSPEGIGESHATTGMPAAAASSIAVCTWSPALFEIMIASTPCVTALVTNSICPVVSAQDAGPWN